MSQAVAEARPNDIRVFDNTMLDAFLRCPRYYYYRHVLCISGRGVKVAAQFGIALHAALDIHYTGGTLEEMIKKFSELFPYEGDKYRTPEVGFRILTYYHDSYPVENEPFEVVHVEKPFEIILGQDKTGKPLHYYGRIDLIGDWNGYGIIVADHKTTTVMNDAYMETKDPNRQFCGYIIAAEEYYDDVYGAMLNAIGIPRTNKTKESPDPDVRREVTTRNKFDKAEWIKETRHIVDMLDSCQDSGVWPKHAPHACRKWNIPCTYMSLCKQKVLRENLRIYKSEFIEDVWNPLVNVE